KREGTERRRKREEGRGKKKKRIRKRIERRKKKIVRRIKKKKRGKRRERRRKKERRRKRLQSERWGRDESKDKRIMNLLCQEVTINLMKSAKVYKIHAIAWIFHFTES
ncbi:hypothetical protein, partial [Shigella flexneri]|uniref:hypothetical protein n=1 Tax=Shigella flexneri TaxID=623 RepID=UPI002096750A